MPAPDLITSAFTRVFDALWVDTGFPQKMRRLRTPIGLAFGLSLFFELWFNLAQGYVNWAALAG